MATGAYMIDGRLNDGWVDYIRTLLTNLLWFLVNKAEVWGKRGWFDSWTVLRKQLSLSCIIIVNGLAEISGNVDSYGKISEKYIIWLKKND
jgi:hypothetical protein